MIVDDINNQYDEFLTQMEASSNHLKYTIDFKGDYDEIFDILGETTINDNTFQQ